jgi:hypothetical protein
MKACTSCEQQNPDDAHHCHGCGELFQEKSEPEEPASDYDLWGILIGPNKSIQFSLAGGWSWRPAFLYYQDVFRRFESPSGHQFSLTWNWPAFLFDPFLWFLYRKMYMYALIYAIGPVVSTFLTGDVTVGVVWRVIAGASGNYIYYWHLKDQIQKVNAHPGLDRQARGRILQEEGGVQTYVLWLGLVLHLLMFGVLVALLEQGPPEEGMPDNLFQRQGGSEPENIF